MNNNKTTQNLNYQEFDYTDPFIPAPQISEEEDLISKRKEELEEQNKQLLDQLNEMVQKAVTMPSYQKSPWPDEKENERLLIDIDCIKDSETGEFHLVIKTGIRIGTKEIMLQEKKKLSKTLIDRLEKLRSKLDDLLKNKQTLISLLK